MQMKRPVALLLPLLVLLGDLAGCGQSVADPLIGLGLSIRSPLNEQNPFADPLVAFVELTAEGPGVKVEAAQTQVVVPYPASEPVDLSMVPYGFRRQVRIGLWQLNPETGQPAGPIIGTGRTIPFDLSYDEVAAGSGKSLFPYVTRVNEFASAVGESGVAASIDARVGLSAEQLPDSSVMFIGGGVPKAGAKDPWNPESYASFSNKVLQYDPNLRAIGDLSISFGAPLNQARGFHASAAGINGLVAISGGWVLNDGKVEATKSVEYFDPQLKKFVTGPNTNLMFARAGHTMTRMFDNDNFFLVVGGQGPKLESQAALTWEIWHPQSGSVAQGKLRHQRWNHAAVRLPETNGGFVMLIGGEGNDNGKDVKILNNFEVIRYDTRGNIARVGNTLITCKMHSQAGVTDYNDKPGTPQGYDKCPALAAQKGYEHITWEPATRKLEDDVARTLPGAVYVNHSAYHFIYMVGGFSDVAHSKPLDRIDIFDIKKGGWVPNALNLDPPRGAPMVAVSMVGPAGGQVLIAGGLGADGKTVAPAEVAYYANPGMPQAELKRWPVKTVIPGGTVAGVAFPLATGHVLIAGGAGISDAGMSPQLPILLWNPQ